MENNEELKQILDETNALDQSTALNKIVIKLLKDSKAENVRLWIALLLFMIFTMLIIAFYSFKSIEQENKFIETQNAYLEFLRTFDYEYVEEGEITTESEVIQQNDNGNNVYQAGEHAIYNQ